jgi:hypothetical protein
LKLWPSYERLHGDYPVAGTPIEQRKWLAGYYRYQAARLLSEINLPHTIVGFTAGKAIRVKMRQPPAMDKRNLMISAAVAVDKSIVLDKFDMEDKNGLAAVDAWLRDLMQNPPETPPDV